MFAQLERVYQPRLGLLQSSNCLNDLPTTDVKVFSKTTSRDPSMELSVVEHLAKVTKLPLL